MELTYQGSADVRTVVPSDFPETEGFEGASWLKGESQDVPDEVALKLVQSEGGSWVKTDEIREALQALAEAQADEQSDNDETSDESTVNEPDTAESDTEVRDESELAGRASKRNR